MSEPCGEAHPEQPDVECDKAKPCWGSHSNVTAKLVWPGTPLPTKKRSAARVAEIASRAERGSRTGPPLSRTTDPATSHLAIELYEPKRESAKSRVLMYLRDHLGEWVDARVLTDEEVGGFAGTRRMRELRDEGFPIETRLKPDTQTTWQHRLVRDPKTTERTT